MSLNVRRIYTRIVSDVMPGIRNKLGWKRPQPRGRAREASQDISIAIPFQYAVDPRLPSVAIICHMFHLDSAETLFSVLAKAEIKADVFISTNDEVKAHQIRVTAKCWKGGQVIVRVAENRGRDIAPKLITFSDVYASYTLILFLHLKRSAHYSFGELWRDYLFATLVGSPANVRSIYEIFELRPDVGLVIPAHFEPLREAVAHFHWGGNFRKGRRLGWKMDIDLGENGLIDFPSGSMFWARPQALRPLLQLNLSFQDFPAEPVGVDGTLAHSIERLFLFSCEKAGMTWVKVLDEAVAVDSQPRVLIDNPKQVGEFVELNRVNLLGAQGY